MVMCDGCITMSMDAFGHQGEAEAIHAQMEAEDERRYLQQQEEEQRHNEMIEREREQQT